MYFEGWILEEAVDDVMLGFNFDGTDSAFVLITLHSHKDVENRGID